MLRTGGPGHFRIDRLFKETLTVGADFNDLAAIDSATAKVVLENPKVLKEDEEKVPAREVLIAMALEQSTLFHSADGTGYSEIPVSGHKEVWPLRSTLFREWLVHRYFARTGKGPSTNAVTEALTTIGAHASFSGRERPVFRRVAAPENGLVIDLGRPDWNAVVITSGGWRIAPHPVSFVRDKATLPLPDPQKGGSLEELWRFLNVTDPDHRRVLVAFMVHSFFPEGPFPILTFSAEQGSGKSTACRVLQSLIDPRKAGLRTLPREERDLAIACANGWLLGFDNVSAIPDWLSDALCRVSTGSGFATRTLYSDQEETLIEVKRPILLNGIGSLISRPDLMDRSIVIELSRLTGDRTLENEFWELFHRRKPLLFGALCDLLSGVLRERSKTDDKTDLRMADFVKTGNACERALGWTPGSFEESYRTLLHHLTAEILDDPVVSAIGILLEHGGGGFSGTYKDLLSGIKSTVPEGERDPRWMPQNPKGLANKLKRLAPTLRQHGFRIETGDHSRQGWTVIISKEKEKTVTMVTRLPGAKTRHFPGDCTGDHGDYAGDDGDHADFVQSLRKSSTGAFDDRVTMVTPKSSLFDLEKERTSEASDTRRESGRIPG